LPYAIPVVFHSRFSGYSLIYAKGIQIIRINGFGSRINRNYYYLIGHHNFFKKNKRGLPPLYPPLKKVKR